MKIGYVTIHYGNNFGTILQTYALYKIIKERLNCDIELIYYVPDHFFEEKKVQISVFSIKSFLLKSFLPVCNNLISKNYSRFIKKNIIITKKYKKDDLINSELDYDLLLVGSDQVWNTDYNKGIDNIFYLDFAKNIKNRVSYASSFGKTKFSIDEKDEIKKKLLSFNHISVRESDAKSFLLELGFNNIQHVLDPTFLLTENEWKRYINKKNIQGKYILIYALDENIDQIIDKARIIAKERNLKVFMISNNLTRNKKVDKLYCYNKVSDFLGLISNADFIITNSFHGTVFSIIFNKQFITLVKTKYNSRINSILKLVNLENRMVAIDLLVESKQYLEFIDFSECNEIINHERNQWHI